MRHPHRILTEKILLYDRWHSHRIVSNLLHWFLLVFVGVVSTVSLLGTIHDVYADTSGVQYSFDAQDLKAFSYNGQSFLNTNMSLYSINNYAYFTTPSGVAQPRINDQSPVKTTGTNPDFIQQVNNSGKPDQFTIKVVFGGKGTNTFTMHTYITNNDPSDTLTEDDMKFYFSLMVPSAGSSQQSLSVGSLSPVAFVNGNWGSMAVFTDNYSPKWNLGSDTSGPTSSGGYTYDMQLTARNIAPGQTADYTTYIRFGSPTDTALTLAPEAYTAFRATYPDTINTTWPDRRPIGTWFIGTSPFYLKHTDFHEWLTNPNGWFADNTIDATDTNATAWAARIMSGVDANITELKATNAQGIIIWDLEGDRNFQPITYIGDPRKVQDSRLAPEWGTPISLNDGVTSSSSIQVIDAMFQKFKDAGFKVGLTIRPQELEWNHDNGCFMAIGCVPDQVSTTSSAAIVATLESKISYAYNRWGVTIFYIDSTAAETDGPIIVQVHKDFPNVLLMPENVRTLEFGVSLPFNYTKFTGQWAGPGMSPAIGIPYPQAAGAMNSNGTAIQYYPDGELIDLYWPIVNAVRQGNLLLFDSWFPTSDISYINKIYASAAQPVTAPTVSASGATAVGTYTATLNGTVNATGNTVIYTRGFEYGTTTSYGTVINEPLVFPAFDESINNTDANFTATVSTLICGATYHYRSFATNFSGSVGSFVNHTASSSDQTFTTTSCPQGTASTTPPVTTPPVTTPATTTAPTSPATTTPPVTTTPPNIGGISVAPQGWWKLDEGSGSTAIDSSTNSNNGTEQGSPTYSSGQIGPYSLVLSSSSSQYIDIHNSSSLQITGDLTISFWLKITNDGNFHGIVSKGNLNEYEVGADFRNGLTNLSWRSTNNPSSANNNWTGFFSGYTDNTWVFVTVVVSGTNATAYKNGVPFGTLAIGTRSSSTNDVLLGARPAPVGYYLDGSLDDVRIYNSALSAAEVSQLYAYNGIVTAPITTPVVPVVTYTLTYNAGPNGSVGPVGFESQTISSGGGGRPVRAIANAGYYFVNWSDGSTANPRRDSSVTSNINVIANFAQVVSTSTPPISNPNPAPVVWTGGGGGNGGGNYGGGNYSGGVSGVSANPYSSYSSYSVPTTVPNYIATLQTTPQTTPETVAVSGINPSTSGETSSSASSLSLSGVVQITAPLYESLSGPQVTNLQKKLIALGFLQPEYVTGYFGAHTLQAVETFQADNKIVSSGSPTTTGFGFVGQRTRAALNGSVQQTTVSTLTVSTTTAPVPVSVPISVVVPKPTQVILVPAKTITKKTSISTTTAPSTMITSNPVSTAPISTTTKIPLFTEPLRVGSSGSEVKYLQVFLNTHGFIVATSSIDSPGHESTYYDLSTANAVALFQQANAAIILTPYGLSQGTGNFGETTLEVANSILQN